MNEPSKLIKTTTFIENCDQEDICNLFNSGAFNDIAVAYLKKALNNIENLNTNTKIQILTEMQSMFDRYTAGEVLSKNK